MALSDLIPWSRNFSAPARADDEADPFVALSRNMNQILEDFSRGFGVSLPNLNGRASWPHLEVSDSDEEVRVVADLPGMEQKDVQVEMHDGVLTLKGEKKSETNGRHYSERWHGQFQRSVRLGPDIDPDKVNATFKNGELTIRLAKRPEAQRQVKRIPIGNG